MIFNVNDKIIVNGKTFEINRIDPLFQGKVNLVGTLAGDSSFLAGRRTIYASDLVKTKNGYKYNWL